MKKITTLCATSVLVGLTASTALSAPQAMPESTSPFNFYLGANAGGHTTANDRSTYNATTGATRVFFKSLATTGWNGGAIAGMELNFTPRFYVANELFYRWMGGEQRRLAPAGNLDTGYKEEREYGFSIMPGIKINGSRLYLRAGLSKARFKSRVDTGSLTSRGAPYSGRYVSGVNAGLGYQTPLFDQLFLQADYIYTHYHQTSSLNTAGTIRDFDRYSSNEFLMGLLYKFNKTPASHNTPHSAIHSGVYLGLQGIYSDTKMKYSQATTSIDLHNDDRVMRGGKVGLSLGYNHRFGHYFYLAEELSYQFLQTKLTAGNFSTTPTREHKVRDGMRIGFSIVPGFTINKANVIYTRLGIEHAKFKNTGSEDSDILGNGANFHEYKNGFRTGIGYETALTDRLSLNGEYDYTIYKRIHNSITDGNGSSDNWYKPRSFQYMLGLKYHF